MIKLDKETKDFLIGNVVGVITGIITLYIYYDYIEKEETRRADSPPDMNSPIHYGNMNVSNWNPLTQHELDQIRRY